MDHLTFWNGLDTIGANVFSLDDGETRIIMDFGMTNEANIEEIHEALPQIPYLFKTQDFGGRLKSVEESPFTRQAVFISHLHIDHIGGLKYLPDDIKVYMSMKSRNLMDHMIQTGMEAEISAEIIGVPFQREVSIGRYSVTFIENDHDIPGSSCILTDNGERRILHSGDVRKNGWHPDNISRMIDIAKPVDLLLMEGTEFSFLENQKVPREKQQTEINLLMDFKKEIERKNGPLIINPYPRNIERLVRINNIALDYGVPVVWTDDTADLLTEYTSRKVYTSDEYNDKLPHIVQLNDEHLEKISNYKNGKYLHMNGVPIGDYDGRFNELMDMLGENRIEYIDLGVSGHASAEDIIQMTSDIMPVLTVPWHTFKPELQGEILKDNGHDIFLPEKRRKYILEDLFK